MKRRALAALVGIIIAVLLLGAVEGILRLTGGPRGYSEYDRFTQWRLRSGYEGAGPDLPDVPLTYTIRVNDDGFRGREVDRAKPSDVVRLVTLGDSVTFGFGVQDDATLAAQTGPLLTADLVQRGKRIEAVNAGVPGFTTLQGRRHLERHVLALSPDVVTIMFGWNDGWRDRVADADIPIDGRVGALLRSSELFGLATKVARKIRNRFGTSAAPNRNRVRVPRVPVPAFEANLVAMAEAVRRAGAVPVFVTLPAAFGPDRPPDSYFQHDWMVPRAELEAMRASYADATRRAAATAKAILVDSAALTPADPGLFLGDGYHPNAAGLHVIAGQVAQSIRQSGTLQRRP